MKSSVLIFGGGTLQLSIISEAIKLGFETVVLDPDPNSPGKGIADFFYVVSGTDYERTLEIAKRHAVKGVVTAATDKPIIMMSLIAKELNLHFPSFESCDILLNKGKFKKFLSSNDLPHAKGITNIGEYPPNHIDLHYPLIVKPLMNSGSRGVIKVQNQSELPNAITETLKHCNSNGYLIEEYIEGDEISVEVLIQNSTVNIIQITDKIVSLPPYNVEMGHIQPSKYSYLKEEINKLLQTVVDKIGLDNCALHPEFKIKDDKLTIIEIGPRLGGDFITSNLVPLSTGLSIEEQAIFLSCGMPIQINVTEQASLISFLNFPLNTTYNNDVNSGQLVEEFPNVIAFSCSLEKGERIKPITNSLDRYGYFILKGENVVEIINLTRNIQIYLTNHFN